MTVEITIHSVGRDECVLSGKEAEGMNVTFADGTVTESFLSNKSLYSLLRMKLGNGNGEAKPVVPPVATPFEDEVQ